jgi:hypothetical protein
MSTILRFGRDAQGMNAFAPQSPDDKWFALLFNGTNTSFTVPSNYENWIAAFSYQPGTAVWVDFSGVAAVVPTLTTLQPCTVELNPSARSVKAGDVINMITSNAQAQVGVALYALQLV